jgi:hypothetical protein
MSALARFTIAPSRPRWDDLTSEATRSEGSYSSAAIMVAADRDKSRALFGLTLSGRGRERLNVAGRREPVVAVRSSLISGGQRHPLMRRPFRSRSPVPLLFLLGIMLLAGNWTTFDQRVARVWYFRMISGDSSPKLPIGNVLYRGVCPSAWLWVCSRGGAG